MVLSVDCAQQLSRCIGLDLIQAYLGWEQGWTRTTPGIIHIERNHICSICNDVRFAQAEVSVYMLQLLDAFGEPKQHEKKQQ